MDNNQTWQIKDKKPEQMQNWKKQILMDPVLNTLFQPSVPVQDFLIKKVMPLPHTQIASIYAKLTTINFQLMQNIQKQVQVKSQIIQKSYLELLAYKQQLQQHNQSMNSNSPTSPNSPLTHKNKPIQYLTYLKNFNKKYETVQNSILIWKNILDCMHFSKAIDNFKVNVNIMKTLMRGYNGNQQTINAIKIAKMIKQLVQLSIQYDFSGIKGFQSQRVFISSTKSIIHSIGCKTLPKLVQQYVNMNVNDQTQTAKKEQLQKNIQDWINAFNNINTIKDFVVSYGKGLLQQMAENIKKYIKNDIPNIANNLQNLFIPFLYESCKSLLFLQQKLILLRKVQLSNVPNLFIRFWQKLCEYLRQTITWIKKDKQRNPPKIRQDSFLWKYPILYINLSKLCSNVQIYLLNTVIYNNYNFAKNKQRLMVNCLIDLAIQYHQQKDKIISQMTKIQNKIYSYHNNKQGNLQQSQSIDVKLKVQIQKYIGNLQLLFQETKCSIIFNSLINSICEKLNLLILDIGNKSKKQKQNGVEVGENLNKNQGQNQIQGEIKNKIDQQIEVQVKILTKIQVEVKGLIKKYGEGYGITKKQLESFKVYK